MQATRKLRYILFSLMFALVLVGLVAHSYPLLIVLAIVAIALGVVGDRMENHPTEPFKRYNELHHHVRKHPGPQSET
ncbi:hypothetical protein GCM10025857_05630 [Alicyclobacillus contaminans]|uniref:hypothetical protein n=1 Tax=Alicyclobacillus contaminans TaxID=392016 RepID=UPI00040B43BE|nr:hypothetical protein [Alicyclobacillus contaminans]GMA49206.1 hypothetical protein GCM10025857_05630 [Alicyclobacillus contaminans]